MLSGSQTRRSREGVVHEGDFTRRPRFGGADGRFGLGVRIRLELHGWRRDRVFHELAWLVGLDAWRRADGSARGRPDDAGVSLKPQRA